MASARPGTHSEYALTDYTTHCEGCDTRRVYVDQRAFDRAVSRPCVVCYETWLGLADLRAWVDERGTHAPQAWWTDGWRRAVERVKPADSFRELVLSVCDGDPDQGLGDVHAAQEHLGQPLMARRMWGHLARYLCKRGARA